MVRNVVLLAFLGCGLTVALPLKASAQLPETCPCGCGKALFSCNMAKCSAKQKLMQQNRELWDAKLAENNREWIKLGVHDYMEALGRDVKVTSEYRENSEAHKRGAIDISSKDLTPAQRREDAEGISQKLGKGYTVVIEEVGADGKQTNTSYRDGKLLNTHKDQPKTASATHTHVQPDKDKDE